MKKAARKLLYAIFIAIGLFIFPSAFVKAGDGAAAGEPAANLLFSPERAAGSGKFFEIKDSQYLNVTLESSEEIRLILESIPKIVSLNVWAASNNINSVVLTIKGLASNKAYFKYQDSYKNEAVFISNENGIVYKLSSEKIR